MRLETFLTCILACLIVVDIVLTQVALNSGAVECSFFGFNEITVGLSVILLLCLFIMSRKVPVTMIKLRAAVLASFAIAIAVRLTVIIINLSIYLCVCGL